MITVVGPVTGAALNPARHLGLMITRTALGAGTGLHWNQTPGYLTATLAAGLLAAATYAFLGAVPTTSSHHSRWARPGIERQQARRTPERDTAQKGSDRPATRVRHAVVANSVRTPTL